MSRVLLIEDGQAVRDGLQLAVLHDRERIWLVLQLGEPVAGTALTARPVQRSWQTHGSQPSPVR
jgi:hypothetical protein